MVCSICRPADQKLEYVFSSRTVTFDHYLKTYEDFTVIGDFNESETSPALSVTTLYENLKSIKLFFNQRKYHILP